MTETALVAGPDARRGAAPPAARRSGVRLAIDDFGTGYSSLSYLRQFPVDILKIDRSFVNTITTASRCRRSCAALLDLGRTLQLETIAEGIETDAQLDQLRASGARSARATCSPGRSRWSTPKRSSTRCRRRCVPPHPEARDTHWILVHVSDIDLEERSRVRVGTEAVVSERTDDSPRHFLTVGEGTRSRQGTPWNWWTSKGPGRCRRHRR